MGLGVIPGAVPVPDNATFKGLPEALCVMASEAVRLPVVAGVKTKASDAFSPGLMVRGRLGGAESAKSEALEPLIERAEMTRSAVPVLLIVSVTGLLAVPLN